MTPAAGAAGVAGGESLHAAIIDLDGTLLDTLGDFVVALNATLDALVLPRIERAFVERTVGRGSEHLIHSTLRHVGAATLNPANPATAAADAALFERAFALYQQHYLAVNGAHAHVYAGVVEGLQQLVARGWKLACLTNKPIAFALPLLRQKGLDGYFAAVFGGDSFERKKPDPLPLLRTCAALGSVPARTLMVGDSSNDAVAARAAGCPVVLVSYGYNHGEPVRGVDADAVIDRLDQLGGCIDALDARDARLSQSVVAVSSP